METGSICERCNKAVLPESTKFTCGHSLCPHCTSLLVFIRHLNELPRQDQITLQCHCKAGVKEFSLVTLHEILTSSQNLQTCSKHNLQTRLFCILCNQWLCEKCIEIHCEVITDHPIMDYPSDIKKCTLHEWQPMQFYCNDCHKEICQLCTTVHFDHKYQPIEEYVEMLRNNIDVQKHEDFAGQLNRIDQVAVNIKDNVYLTLEKFDDLVKVVQETKRIYEKKMSQIVERTDLLINILKLLFTNYYYDLKRSMSSPDIHLLEALNDVKKSDFIRFRLECRDETGNKVDNLQDSLNTLSNYLSCIIQPNHICWSSFHSWKNTMTLNAHTQLVWSITELDDGRIASGSGDETIKIWELQGDEFKNTITLTGHTESIRTVIQLNDGRLASGSIDKTIKIWQLNSKDGKNTLTLSGHNGSVRALIQLTDGRIASASEDETIKLWEIREKDITNTITLTGHNNYVLALLQMIDGRLASGSGDDTVKIWEIDDKTFKNCMTLTGHTNSVLGLFQLRDGRLASSSDDKTIRIWDITKTDFKNTLTFANHTDTVWTVIQLKDGRIVSGSEDRTIKIWEVNEKYFNNTLTLTGHDNAVLSIIQLQDGRIVSASEDNMIKIWD